MQFFGPSLRALTIIIKALLKQAGLNERVSGGLGSYCILNLVMAHLISEGVRATSLVNLGHLLLSLLQFFGRTMDCRRHAISVSRVSPSGWHLCAHVELAAHVTMSSDVPTPFKCLPLKSGGHCGQAAAVAAGGQAVFVGRGRPSASWYRHWLRLIQHSRGVLFEVADVPTYQVMRQETKSMKVIL